MTTMANLPVALVEEILSRVPTTSLKRLRSSCKRWNLLFHDKEFARKQFHKAAKQSFVFTMTKELRTFLISVDHHGIPSVVIKGEFDLLDNSNQVNKVCHCDGLLLCSFYNNTRIMLWNPCTAKTRWIQPINPSHSYSLGSYQETKHGNTSYKILSCRGCYEHEFAIYEINSDSWRILDVIPDFNLSFIGTCVYLKGKTYWFAKDIKDEQRCMFLVSFDYTTERFERLNLPYKCPLRCIQDASLSVVSEEKLSMLLLRKNTWEKEIWVTNKIDGAKEVSWRKFLTVDYPKRGIWITSSHFLVDEEKKVALCCEKCIFDRNTTVKKLVYIAGEDNKVKPVDLGAVTLGTFWPTILDYVPSLVQILPSGGRRENRGY